MAINVPIYTVDTGVPIPQGSYTRIPLAELNVGESILFPLSKRRSVQSLASRLKADTGKEFTVKKQDSESARIWRIK